MPPIAATSSGAKQGDHVFNMLEGSILRPFETIASFHSPDVNGELFLHDFLPLSYTMARQIVADVIWRTARTLVAKPGDEEELLRDLAKLKARFPVLMRVDAAKLRDAHLRNATQFGLASARFEWECLNALLESLTAAVNAAARPDAGVGALTKSSSPIIGFMSMMDAAYDPAAALVVIAKAASAEGMMEQGAIQKLIVAVSDSIDRPAVWREPYLAYRESRTTQTGETIGRIRAVLDQFPQVKIKGQTFLLQMQAEVTNPQKGRLKPEEWTGVFGSMIHLLYARIQQIGAARR
jgi:hypothetical protein